MLSSLEMLPDIYRDAAIVVPAHNEARSIGRLVAMLVERCEHVIVVDDGSLDGTGRIARDAGAVVVRHDRRQGKGAALRTGIDLGLRLRVAWLALLDGDLQHSPADLDRLMRLLRRNRYDMVVGQRFLSKKMPWLRRMTNRVMSFVIRRLTGYRMRDTQCGLRVISNDALNRMRLRTTGYDFETEILIEASRLNMNVGVVDIATIYPKEGKSSIRPLVDAVRWIRLISETSFS